MTVTLTDFEIDLLNRYIPMQTFNDLGAMRVTMRNQMRECKNEIISAGETTEAEFETFTNRSVDHIDKFLMQYGFFHDRDGQVFALTEKGKHLKQQGTVQKYVAWEKDRNAVLIDEMHTIEKQGYLKREQPTPAELGTHHMSQERKSHLIYYVLIIIAIAAFFFIGKYHKFN